MGKFEVKRKEVKDNKKEIQVSEDMFALLIALNDINANLNTLARKLR